jgi:hypothetical protein
MYQVSLPKKNVSNLIRSISFDETYAVQQPACPYLALQALEGPVALVSLAQ